MTFLKRVIVWELMRHLRNKQFIIGLFVTPFIFAVFAGVPTLIERFDRPQEQVYLIVDELNMLPGLRQRLAESDIRLEKRDADEIALREAVSRGEADGYFVLDATFLDSARLPIYMENVRPRPEILAAALSAELQSLRMQEQQIDATTLEYISVRPNVFTTGLERQDETTVGNLPMAIAASALLFILIMSSGTMLLQSALQEKRDRMSEVILSSVEPDTLMGGKIIAHFLLGVFQIIFWLIIVLPIAYFVLNVPIGDYITPSLIPIYALFTLLGYLFYAALFVGIGATMEDIQSASNSQGMVFMLPMLSFFVVGPVIGNPEGFIARVAMFFPLTSPVISILRMGFTSVPMWEILTATIIMLASTFVVIKVASRIFRTGMLMYGKNASLKEIWKWMWHA